MCLCRHNCVKKVHPAAATSPHPVRCQAMQCCILGCISLMSCLCGVLHLWQPCCSFAQKDIAMRILHVAKHRRALTPACGDVCVHEEGEQKYTIPAYHCNVIFLTSPLFHFFPFHAIPLQLACILCISICISLGVSLPPFQQQRIIYMLYACRRRWLSISLHCIVSVCH